MPAPLQILKMSRKRNMGHHITLFRKVQTNIYSLDSSCSTAMIPCRFSATRAARRSRTAYGKDIIKKEKDGSKSDEPCSWYDEPPFGPRAPSCVTSQPWPCECTPSIHACSWKHYPWIFDRGCGSFIPQEIETTTLESGEKSIHTDVCRSCQPPCTSAITSSAPSVSSST